jgi:hypothetical protein
MAMRKIRDSFGYKLGYDSDWNEYQVGPSDEEWGSDKMYHTDDKDDAFDTWDLETAIERAEHVEG